jgi:hypothetical protein
MKKAFLFLLGLLASFGVQAQTSPWVGNEVKAGEFYLYNVESGLWLQNNDSKANDWSTRAAIGTRGLNFTLAGSEGAYTLGAGFGSASINPDNNYLDTGNNPAWTFTPVEVDGVTNAYKINCDNKVLGVVRYNEAGKLDNLFTQTGDERWYLENPDYNIDMTANNTWQLVTKEERLAKMQADASVDTPQDASWLIPSADFANNDRRWDNLWTHDLKGGNGRAADSNDFRGSKCVESWNSGNAIDFYISINVPNGTYKLSVQGYYRDGNVDDVVNRRNDGTETIRAYYFANEVSHPLMSILDEAKDAKVDGAWDTNRGGLWYPDSQLSANRCFNLHKGYVNPEIEVVVTTGVLKIGVRKDGGVGGDWIVVDNFKLTYLGNNIDLTTYLEALQTAIDNGNAFDTSSTSSVLAQALAAAISDGQSALSSTDPDEISAATAAITNAISAAKAVDLSVLKATIALAKQEGIDTSAAEELEASATEIGPVNDALFDLRAARKVKAQAMPDIYTGSEPAEGKVYIYNLGTGLFLGTGSSYNTHCAVDQVGIEVELIASGTGFKIKTGRGGGWLAKGNEASENASVYVDSWNGDQVWQFLPVDGQEGVYNISFDGTTNDLLGYNPHTLNDNNTGKFWGSIGKMRSDVSDPMNQWKIVTAEERESLIAAASKDNPVDVSYLIKSPSMNAQDSRDADWTREVNGGNGGAWVNNTENHGYEVWNADDFKIHQTIEGLKPGLYEVSVSGFWREGDGANQANIVNNGGALQQKAYLYANDQQALLKNIASCPDFAPGFATQASVKGNFPNWPAEGLEYFEVGAFKTSLNVIVEDDGTLTLGVGVDEKVAFGDWVVMDNFRLTYLGGASDYDRALVSIEDGKNYRVFTEVDGEKYYLTANGVLDDQLQKAGVFNFKKVEGEQYEYGFQLTSPLDNRFTNPYSTADSWLTIGRLTVTDGKRTNYEAQVFFQNEDGKFAVRGTNAKYNGETSGWAYISNSYWTVNEGPLAEYSFEPAYVWQLEEAEADNRQEILTEVRPTVEKWGKMLQDIDGLVTDASMYYANSKANESIGLPGLLDGDYNTYFHTMWGNSGVTEAHYLEATLPDAADKFYYYFVKRDPVNNGNTANRPIHIAISGSNDGETFTPITEVYDMPLTVPPVNYMSELITADQAYKIIRFTVLDTNNHATDNNGNKFFTFSEFYVLPSNELTDAATALLATDYTDIPLDATDYIEQVEEMDAILKGYFKDVDLNLVLNDEVLATVETTILIGKEAPAAPTSFYTNEDVQSAFNGLAYFKPDVDEVTEETDAINYTAESAISESFERAKWFNMNIRGGYWVTMDETEPYMPTEEKDLESEASQWAFGAVEGEPNQIVIWNRAAGPDMSLLNTGEVDANNKPLVAMREGQTAWDFAPNSDGFVIHQVGTGENEWVNQNGGATGPFSIWNSGYAKGDAGSVLRIFFVEETEPIDPYDAALAEIKNNHHYRVFTEVAGEKYYVNGDGTLTTDAEAAPSYLFQQAPGGEYEYGFKLNNNGTYFSNPSSGSSINDTKFNTSTRGDNAWEAQVFFLNGDGFYAVRSTNAPAPPEGATSGWNWVGSAYWTVNEAETPTAGYSFDKESNFIWQLEPDPSYLEIALNLVSDGSVIKTEIVEYLIGDTPEVPQSFREETHGLALFTCDVDEIAEETSEVNFTAESILSESFEKAKWYNMNIRGGFWVATEEGEQYNPTADKDLEAPESQWAFGAVEGEPNQLIVWNRAFDGTYTLQTEGGNGAKALMAEGEQIFEAFTCKDGFVIRPLGLNENDWINQFGGSNGYLGVWQSGGGRNDDGSILRVFPVETENLEIAIDVERYVGQGYTPTIAEVDFTEALEYLGVEAVTEDMLYFVNPDGTEMDYATYKVSPTPDFTYDGWCDAEGAAAQWNSTTNMINVKFFEAIPDGQFSICDMNGADEVGKTYTVKWALKANDKAVVYAVNVTFVDAPELTYTFDELDKVATEDLNIKSEIGDAYEGLNATVDIDAILAALEVESLGDVIIAAVQPDGTLDTNYMLGGTDGWRDADGTWKSWSDNLETAPYFYVKTNFEATPQIYQVGGYPGHTDEAATFTAPFVFVKNGTNQAYVLNVNLVYGESGAVAYDGTVDVTGKIQGQVVAEAPTADETITITPNEDGTVNINFASLTLAAPEKPVNDFIVENVVVTENEDGSVSYSLEGATVSLTAASGMIMTYNATLTGTQAEGEGPELTLILAQPSGLQNEIVFHPNALVPEAEEFDGMIKQILSHPQTGVQGQATGEQKVTIAATGDGKADITYSGFTMPVTGAEIPEFTVEGVIVTENEDGTISYALPEDAEAEVIIDRGTGVVKYAVTLEGTQESADATPVLKLTLENSVVDTVWFGADEKTIDKAIATSIRGINALGTEGNIYDLSGRKVEKIQRGGIYIVNGKKVSVK